MQVELLGLLLLQEDRAWTLSELAALLKAPVSSVHRELLRAVDAGIATRDGSQRPHLFRAAANSPAFEPLRRLLELTVGAERLGRALASIDGVIAAAMHGSWVAGRIRPDSDIDVIVVTDGDRRQALRAVRREGRSIGREVDAVVLSPEELETMQRSGNPFIRGILRGPRVDLVGDLTELATSG